ncbi:unnamed protein product [Mytilus coruscus]|uniref:G-protein coupled receptors family 2 profile 2 domain-containing protein n=1 Tax=Mytilus coruscus TaxID=42192 RepID=A0A6J8E2E8_MYTCO|nr:unnamed protein product [Mytilus coruscus]
MVTFILNIAIVSLHAFNVNATNLFYQYALICGPNFHNSSLNIWSFPSVPKQLNICKECNRSLDCSASNCCPDIELSRQVGQCESNIIYSSEPNEIYNQYRMLSTCLHNTRSTLNELCVKRRSIQQRIQDAPVTSRLTRISFRNKFCALCSNETDYIPWDVDLIYTCNGASEYLTAKYVVETIASQKCGTIKYRPGIKGVIQCNKPDFSLIHTCNVTGTWLKFDKDIEFACNKFENKFKYYKNIFCYICNPPVIFQERLIISKCNLTGLWTKYSRDMENSCRIAEQSKATYPYKNIFCYICNHNIPEKNVFHLEKSLNSFKYYLFDNFHNKDHYKKENETFDSESIANGHKEFYRWHTMLSCQISLPVGVLENNHLTFENLGMAKYCNITKQYIDIFVIDKKNHSLAILFKMYWAFVFSTDYIIYSIYNDTQIRRTDCSEVHDMYFRIFTPQCESFIQKENYRYPLEYLMCFCSKRSGTDVLYRPIFIGGKTPFNIFRIKSYSTLESQCRETQIYDHYKDKCRTTGCFISKKFHQKRCVDDSSFNISGYTLPLKLEQVNKSEFIIDKVIANMNLQCNWNITYSTPFCLNDVENKNDSIFFLLIEAVNQLNRTHFEHELLEFISGDYMSQYINTINLNDKKIIADVIYNRNQSILCIPSLYPLLSKILMCRHVVFKLNEYSNVDFIVRVNGFVNEFQLYDYHIDTNNDLWLCLEDFNSLEKPNDYTNVIYFVIFIICSVVSSLSLLMTLTTYCLFPKLRTVPGKNIMSLSVSLLLHHITFILFMTTHETGTFCMILAISMHYFLLSSFGCLFVCAWHMFKIFGTGSIALTIEASRNKNSIRWYITFSYLYGLMLIVTNIIIYATITDGESIGYGDRHCFISFREMIFATLITPLVILSGADIILFVITVYRLKNRPRIMTDDTEKRKDVWIFLRLFAATGCSWILLLINAFVENSILALIISCINSLQGLYIFIAYICNKRIYNMYISKLRRGEHSKKKKHSPSTSLTSLTKIRANIIEQSSPLIQRKINT